MIVMNLSPARSHASSQSRVDRLTGLLAPSPPPEDEELGVHVSSRGPRMCLDNLIWSRKRG